MNIFFAPHSDDEALFGSYIIQRTKPLIVVCTDGTLHEQKFGISVQTRRQESREAAKLFGVDIEFMGIREPDLTKEKVIEMLNIWYGYEDSIGFVFAPTKTGGSPHHDIISDAVTEWFSDSALYYGTYTRENFAPTGEMALYPTKEEKELKEKVLQCYVSQLGINKAHFDAVKDVPEYLSFKP